ncbi:hypothetical protein JCM11251_003606 [Rhodosporidiobolus azoricus]
MDSLSFSCPPKCIAGAAAPDHSKRHGDAFFRDVDVCPDGSCLLATGDDRSLSLFTTPSIPSEPSPASVGPYWTHLPSDALLSTAWYPGASSSDPAMFAFAAAVKDHPVTLLDGFSRTVRASYPIVDHVERFVAPHSMDFSPDGTSLYCGFDNAIEIFDVSAPGAAGTRLSTTPTRSSKSGQKGIISALAFSAGSTSTSPFLAAGSFGGTVGLYDPASPTPMFDLLYPTQRGGVTQLLFNPFSPHLLFVASRQSSSLDVFDLRNTKSIVSHGKMKRSARTNQRMRFSIDPTGTWLAAGDQNGDVSIFSAQPLPDQLEPVTTFSLSNEPLGATVFHPSLPVLITCSGTRHFKQRRKQQRRGPDKESSDETSSSSESDDGEDDNRENEGKRKPSLQFWELS